MKYLFIGLLAGAVITGIFNYLTKADRVSFTSCDGNMKNCEPPTAWFKDRESCEYYRKFQDAYCDYNSQPGKAICDFTRPGGAITVICK